MSNTPVVKKSSPQSATQTSLKQRLLRHSRPVFAFRLALALLCGAALALLASVVPHAQRSGKEQGVRVTSVTARPTASGSVYTLAADAPVTRPQTWHDDEGLHIVLYKGQSAGQVSNVRGVKQRQVGDSLEFVLPVRSSQFALQQRGNNLDVVVNNPVNSATESASAVEATRRQTSVETLNETRVATGSSVATRREKSRINRGETRNSSSTSRRAARQTQDPNNLTNASDVANALTFSEPRNVQTTRSAVSTLPGAPSAATSSSSSYTPAPLASSSSMIASSANPVAPVASASPVSVNNTETAATNQEESDEIGNEFYLYAIALLALLISALFFVKRRKGKIVPDEVTTTRVVKQTTNAPMFEKTKGKSSWRKDVGKQVGKEVASIETKTQSVTLANKRGERTEQRTMMTTTETAVATATTIPVMMFGAYQIDQELNKMLHGQPHRIDVLCSRAPDDRRALESSLMKHLRAADVDETNRRKVRATLEEYGFVARLSAALLLAPDAFERVSSARVLGEVQSTAALPFLLEALYDREISVRTEAVVGLGSLGSPAAIGALLDAARRHPDIPSPLLSDALTRCSVHSLDFDGELVGNQPLINSTTGEWLNEMATLKPSEKFEQLPAWLEDANLAEAMERLSSTDAKERAAAARILAQFQVQRAVEALAGVAAHDEESVVRAAATASLGITDHESVFEPVLLRLIDDAREVRAAAARSLSRFSFDRADAYVRVIENADEATLDSIARALVETGFAAQAIERLVSEDRHQAYEAFSVLSLIVKANQPQVVLDAVATHGDIGVRLALVRFLRISSNASALAQLKELDGQDDFPEDIRNAIAEANFTQESDFNQTENIFDESQATTFAATLETNEATDCNQINDLNQAVDLNQDAESNQDTTADFNQAGNINFQQAGYFDAPQPEVFER